MLHSFSVWNYTFWGSSWSVWKSEAAEFPFDLWALVSTTYAVCHVKVHKRIKLLFLFLISHFSNTVSWNFELLEPTCQIDGRTSTVTQDKPLAFYLVTQKVFICQEKHARYVSQLLASICISDLGRNHVSLSERVCLFIFILFFPLLNPVLLSSSVCLPGY